MLSLYITLAICGTILAVILMLRDRLKEFFLSLSSEGKLETKVTANDQKLPQNPENPFTTDISRNKTVGKTKMLLERDRTRVVDNDFKGVTDITEAWYQFTQEIGLNLEENIVRAFIDANKGNPKTISELFQKLKLNGFII
jgi:hypothetical protein